LNKVENRNLQFEGADTFLGTDQQETKIRVEKLPKISICSLIAAEFFFAWLEAGTSKGRDDISIHGSFHEPPYSSGYDAIVGWTPTMLTLSLQKGVNLGGK
jgi:hypothetical protein